jgi:O-methyltransferase
VVHDWDDARSQTILRNCRRAMPASGTLLLVEPLMPPRVESPAIIGMVMSDLNMLVVAGGRERTEVEFRALFESAGLTLTSISPPLGTTTYRLIEGRPA